MQKQIRFLSLFLIFILCVCLIGCGKKTDEDKIEGEWKSTIGFNQLMSVLEGETAFSKVTQKIDITVSFKNGEYVLKLDAEKALDTEEFNSALAEYIKDMLGMTPEEIKDAYGKDITALAKEKTDEMREAFSIGETMTYEFKDGKLYLDNTHQPYRFGGDNTLILDLEDFGELEFVRD